MFERVAMYLFLKFGEFVKIVSNISVDDDCAPVVEGKTVGVARSPSSPVTSGPTPYHQQHLVSIEAIPWFKSQVIEAVYIDCSSRSAWWVPKVVTDQLVTTIPDPPSAVDLLRKKREEKESMKKKDKEEKGPLLLFSLPPAARPFFRQGRADCDFDPTADEMFERAERILTQADAQKLLQEDVVLECAQLLHCCVFPAIAFQKADVALLQGCVRRYSIKIRSMEKEIIEKQNNIGIREVALTKQKEIIIAKGDFSSESYVRACRQDFVDVFYVHIKKDTQEKNMSLEIVQRKINDLRKNNPDSPDLDKIVKERDVIHETLGTLMTIRETICNVLYRPHVPRKKKVKKKVSEANQSLYQVFVETDRSLRVSRDELKRLYYRKLHLAAMREAIESTIKMVESGACHGSCDFSEFSIIIQEEGRERSSPMWSSLQGKVADIMGARESPIYTIHVDRCQLIKDLIQSIISDQMVPVQRSAVVIPTESSENELLPSQEGEMDSVTYTFSFSNDTNSRLSEQIHRAASSQLVTSVKNQVVSHIWDIARRVVTAAGLDPNSARHANRAWLCYMPYFCQEALESLEALYAHVYSPNVTALYQNVANLALADIVDDKFFADFFVNGLARDDCETGSEAWDIIVVPRAQSNDSVSALSLDLQRCSVTELYAMADRDCAKLCQEMVDLDFQDSPSESPMQDSGEDNPKGTGSRQGNSDTDSSSQQQPSRPPSTSDSGGSIHSEDLFPDCPDCPDTCQKSVESVSLRSSQKVQSVVGMFESVVQPFNDLVQEALECPDVLGKLRIICQSTRFLNQKVEKHCKSQGMDSLLPMSIFATVSLRQELFVRFYIQLVMLIDLKPDFFLHSMYDFSLTSVYTPYLFLFDRKVTNSVVHSLV